MGTFLLATAPFILPVVLAVGRFHLDPPSDLDTARMDKIYALCAMPHCCDPTHFMSPIRWDQASTVFALTPLLLLFWPERRAVSILNAFVTVLVVLFFVGIVARHFEMFWLLKLYPLQLAKAIPLMRWRYGRFGVLLIAWLVVGFGPLWYDVSRAFRARVYQALSSSLVFAHT